MQEYLRSKQSWNKDMKVFIRENFKEGLILDGRNNKSFEGKMIRWLGSWGEAWGIDGDCLINASDVAALLAARGEACIPTVRCV